MNALTLLVQAISQLTEEDWQKIDDATRNRLLSTEFDGEDTRSNRVVCRSVVSNALFDIRDALRKETQVPRCSASEAHTVIAHRISPWEIVGDVTFDDRTGEWRAAIMLRPSGPLVLAAYRIAPTKAGLDAPFGHRASVDKE